ncbi:MAG: hypothetical protein NC548_28650 [Lachnospiraceae bacterium]|nr:hypothetical protein [Lachnospiraceae bacterium]MCM1235538.1 hypothetical protein [Ruminococcus flavefaciens]
MRKVTSAIANKLVKQYNEELQRLYTDEAASMEYTEVEGIKPVVPAYDICGTRAAIKELSEKIVAIKHAINTFNCSHYLPATNVTIDSALVRIAMLSKEKSRLEQMLKPNKKSIKTGFGVRSNQIEYAVLNYDVADARTAYDDVSRRLVDMQLQLDVINTTVAEVEIPD